MFFRLVFWLFVFVFLVSAADREEQKIAGLFSDVDLFLLSSLVTHSTCKTNLQIEQKEGTGGQRESYTASAAFSTCCLIVFCNFFYVSLLSIRFSVCRKRRKELVCPFCVLPLTDILLHVTLCTAFLFSPCSFFRPGFCLSPLLVKCVCFVSANPRRCFFVVDFYFISFLFCSPLTVF